MSMVLNGTTQYAHRATAPSASSWCATAWVRRDADSGAYECLYASWDSGNNAGSWALIDNGDGLLAYHRTSPSAAALSSYTTTVWRFVQLRYTGGVITITYLNDGDSAWGTSANVSSLTDLAAPDTFLIGASRTTPTDLMGCTVASLKVWSGGTLPNDTDLLAERLSTDVTATTGLWANYDFLTGALDTDRSGNARTLTLVATPTFSSAKPSDLTVPSYDPPFQSNITISFRAA